MPVYLVHGFRWPRIKIRHQVILQNIDDASPEYIMSPASSAAIIAQLHTQFPTIMAALPHLRFVEQYDPADTSFSAQSQPYAYVTDKVAENELSITIEDTMAQGLPPASWEAMAELRDNIAPGANIGWFVVYNGDPERAHGSSSRSNVSQTACLSQIKLTRIVEHHEETNRRPKKVFYKALGWLSLYESPRSWPVHSNHICEWLNGKFLRQSF